jgi:chromosome segregation ATPase
MNTMTPGTQSQIDDLLDARASVRQLRRELANRRLALREVKEKLATATDRLEDLLTELEQRQGRLPFADDAQAEAPSNGSAKLTMGKGARKHAAAAAGRAGQSSWKETR